MGVVYRDNAGHISDKPITVAGNALTYIEITPDLDYETVQALGKPTRVYQGMFAGWSLPVYAADNEELFLIICVPNRYDGESDIMAHIDCWLAQAEDTKNSKLQLSWEHFTPTDVVPATSTDVEVQTATGADAAQFQSYKVAFTIDYDIHTPNNIVADDILGLRLRRIAATANECAGGIVIGHLGASFRRDKLGVTSL